ncbi:hypothetical protein WJX74_008728 [Apatococcus lobatus]|uniref:Photolyase/cryptochrome alpha/beta domain-containing protein n=1 Tax=Apatococcus lobatus TaxID=904363 RepID=A0AAW1S436_9CHLO
MANQGLSVSARCKSNFTGPSARTVPAFKIPRSPVKICSAKSARSQARSNGMSHRHSVVPARSWAKFAPRPRAGGGKRTCVVWFRNDLRLQDHEALCKANQEALTVLPVICFDPRHYGKAEGAQDGTSKPASIGNAQAQFQLQATADLRRGLRNLGSDLIIRIGRPEQVLSELVKKVGAAAVYCQSAVTAAEVAVQRGVSKAVEGQGATLKAVWGSQTLHCPDKLPFQITNMPTSFGAFSRQIQGVKVPEASKGPGRMRARPAGAAGIDPGKVPTPQQLGLATPRSSLFYGGEAEAVKQAEKVAASVAAAAAAGRGCSLQAALQKACCPRSDMSPWLSAGCISSRRLLSILLSRLQDTDSREQVKRDLLYRDFYTFLAHRKALQTSQQGAPDATSLPAKTGVNNNTVSIAAPKEIERALYNQTSAMILTTNAHQKAITAGSQAAGGKALLSSHPPSCCFDSEGWQLQSE